MVIKCCVSGCQLICMLEWYKEVVLGAGKEQKDKGENQESQGGDGQEEVEEEEGTVEEKPALPRKKDGTVSASQLLASHSMATYQCLGAHHKNAEAGHHHGS